MRQARGFSLLELMLVLAILALAYAVVPPMFSATPGAAEMRSAARQLAAGLRRARDHAVSRRTEAVFTLDVERRRFTVSGDRRSHRLPEGLELKLVGARSEVIDDRQASIRFYPDGSCSGGRVTLSAGPHRFEVDVDWLTGRVAILN